jgi:L-ribulokinase
MLVAGSSQACALGGAIAAAVLAGPEKGGHADFPSAQSAMCSLQPVEYSPIPENQAIYERLFALYRQIHDSFGGLAPEADLSRVMKDLLELKSEVRASH